MPTDVSGWEGEHRKDCNLIRVKEQLDQLNMRWLYPNVHHLDPYCQKCKFCDDHHGVPEIFRTYSTSFRSELTIILMRCTSIDSDFVIHVSIFTAELKHNVLKRLICLVQLSNKCVNKAKTKNIYIFVYTKILELNLFAFAYRLFHEDFSPNNGAFYFYFLCMF